MVLKFENPEIVIDGKSVLKAAVAVYIVQKIYKAIYNPTQHYYTIVEVKNSSKEPKKSKKK